MPAEPTRRGIEGSEPTGGTSHGSDAVSSSDSPRVLVGGVGYRFLRDLSFGPIAIEALRREEWRSGVDIEDLSYGPIAILHNLEARLPYDRIVLIAGTKRGGRPPGLVTEYRWDGRLPEDEEEIQARIAEAGSGVISLDNLLVVLTWFRRLPRELVIIEVEGSEEEWGEGFSPAVERAIPEVAAAVRRHTELHAAARRTLVAGFGSLLLGDDGFGVRVLERLAQTALPPEVELLEVGTGGLNLVLTLMNRYSDLVIVDAVRQGRAPGTLFTFHPAAATVPPETGVDPHFAEPTRAMGLAAALGVLPGRVTVVGCEPGSCELGLELSPAVGRAVDGAAEAIREMIARDENS